MAKAPKTNGSAAPRKPPAAPAEPSKNARQRTRDLESRIERAEAELARLETELADPAAWNDSRSAERSTKRHAKARKALDELYAQWEAAAS